MSIQLILYQNEQDIALFLIQHFWKNHNDYLQSRDEARDNLNEWTQEGHQFYLIKYFNDYIGFVHLGSRGGHSDWLEDLFILPDYQNQGIGTYVIELIEDIVKQYSDSLYIEAAAKNEKAIRLYHKNGYNCLNTITVRKDFTSKDRIVDQEKLYDLDFVIKKRDV